MKSNLKKGFFQMRRIKNANNGTTETMKEGIGGTEKANPWNNNTRIQKTPVKKVSFLNAE